MGSNDKPSVLPMGPGGLEWEAEGLLGGNLKGEWIRDGFVVIPNVFTPDQIQRYNAIVSKVRSEVDDGKDEQGFGDRIGQLHQKEPDLLELASSPKIIDFLQ